MRNTPPGLSQEGDVVPELLRHLPLSLKEIVRALHRYDHVELLLEEVRTGIRDVQDVIGSGQRICVDVGTHLPQFLIVPVIEEG